MGPSLLIGELPGRAPGPVTIAVGPALSSLKNHVLSFVNRYQNPHARLCFMILMFILSMYVLPSRWFRARSIWKSPQKY